MHKSQTPNIDPNEIDKFNDLAHAWWDLEGDFAPLHAINPLRLKFIQDHVNLDGKNIIDIGCGGGLLCEGLAKAGGHLTGLDLAPDSLIIAREHALINHLSINYINDTAEAYSQKNAAQFEVITCLEMLEHVPDPASIVMACATLAKPGAHLFFSTINRNLKAYLSAIIGAEYILGLLPKQTHDYAKFIKPSELATWCRNAGLQWQHTLGLTYNPLTREYSTTASTEVNYLVHCIKE
jgi:2-polyprenyl-6-hydroxyphenyl methylase/3-demethylubiquinone-9 3-methyltransferase